MEKIEPLCLAGKCESESVSCSVVSNCLWPHGLWPARLLCPWAFPGKNTGVGCQSLLQGIFPTQGLNPGLLNCRQTLPSTIWATREDCLGSYNGILYSSENNYSYLHQHGWMWKNLTLNKIKPAAAKSLQSCPTLCDPIDGSPPGSPVPGILQARTLEWVAISFSST